MRGLLFIAVVLRVEAERRFDVGMPQEPLHSLRLDLGSVREKCCQAVPKIVQPQTLSIRHLDPCRFRRRSQIVGYESGRPNGNLPESCERRKHEVVRLRMGRVEVPLLRKRPEWAVGVGWGLKCPSSSSSGHLRSGEIVLKCGEIPGQQLVDAVDRVIGDLFEHAAEIKFRVKPI